MLLELTKEEVEALNHMLKVEINSYKTDELESEEFNTLIQFAKKVRNIEPSEALQWARIAGQVL
jgi:Asp-tRNA(Asn)/Glu-tRNA(Gln) amidotransferase C subunit